MDIFLKIVFEHDSEREMNKKLGKKNPNGRLTMLSVWVPFWTPADIFLIGEQHTTHFCQKLRKLPLNVSNFLQNLRLVFQVVSCLKRSFTAYLN